MLRQGPVDKNDGKPCETWELTRRSATLLGNIKPCPPGKIWSQDHESKSRWLSAKTRYFLILVLEIFSSFTSVRTPSHVPLFVLFPSHTQARHLSNSTLTSLEHHWYTNWFYFISSFRGLEPQTPCQAPGLGSFIANVILSQVHVRNRIVDFQCFGKGLWTKTMANHVKPENLQGDLRHY